MERMNITEAAAYLGVSPLTVRTMISHKRLSATPSPIDRRQKLIPKKQLDNLKAGRSAFEDEAEETETADEPRQLAEVA